VIQKMNRNERLPKINKMFNQTEEEKYYYCRVCGRKISKEEYEAFDGLCEECWEDEMTEEIDTTEGTDEEFVPI